MNLPEEFLKRMEKKLGSEFPAFLLSYNRPPERGIRVNTLKVADAEILAPFLGESVPWSEHGYYLKDGNAGGHPFHAAGLYYLQEPSAMCAAPLLSAERGERVLDLCAAPGGKSTALAADMAGEGLLVANEYDPSRARTLLSNVERMGIKNCVVTNAEPSVLAAAFPAYFDKVLVDAPCSGEGMFKKEDAAIENWSEQNVRGCAVRQAQILESAAKMLRVGGKMVYSTCTFSEEENELQIEDFLRHHKEFSLIREEKLSPHRVRGEGHFAALLQKTAGERGNAAAFRARCDSSALRAWHAFEKCFFIAGESGLSGTPHLLADGRLCMIPEGMPDMRGVRILRAGTELGEWDGRVFKPVHALAMCVKGDTVRHAELSEDACERYLRGETLFYEAENGWLAACYRGYPLGLCKCVNGTLKNHLPKGLRKMSKR